MGCFSRYDRAKNNYEHREISAAVEHTNFNTEKKSVSLFYHTKVEKGDSIKKKQFKSKQ